MMIGDRRFGLYLPLQLETRFTSLGVPGVEILASGPGCVFHRVQGVLDSGASRTLLMQQTAVLLGIFPGQGYVERIDAAGGTIRYREARMQFRVPIFGKPPVTFFLLAGITSQLGENLFGSDFLQYFSILIGPKDVHLLADEHFGGPVRMISNRLAKADPRLACLIPRAAAASGFTGAAFPQDRPGNEIEVVVVLNREKPPERFGDLKWWRVAPGMFTLKIRETQFDDLLSCPEVESVYGPQLMRMATDASLQALRISALRPESHLARTGKDVVIGIIDHGFDVTHADFRNDDDTTRVAFLWDQSQKGKDSSPFGYGLEYTAEEINAALQQSRDDALEILQHRPDPGAHGTLVAGIAAGNGRSSDTDARDYMGVAPDARLILVNLARDAHNLVPHQHVLQALEYIFDKAENAFEEPPDFEPQTVVRRVRRRIAPRRRKLPCVVNLSYSRNDGGHDGHSPVEQAIDRLLMGTAGRAVVVAVGNAGNDQLHAEWQYRKNESTELHWIIPSEAQQVSGSYDAELWYSSRDHVSVQLISPEGEESSLIPPGLEHEKLFSGTATHIKSARFWKPGADARIFVRLQQPAMPGAWILRLKASADSHEGVLHAWIDDTPNEPGRASFANAVTKRSTVASPATARYCVTVGNVDHRQTPMQVVDKSGRGPTRDGREKPEVLAPGQDITSSAALGGLEGDEGVLQPLHCSGSGTSMSAPYITGIIACLFQEHSGLTATEIQRVLVAAGTADHYDEAAGYGIVDAKRALELVRNDIRSQ